MTKRVKIEMLKWYIKTLIKVCGGLKKTSINMCITYYCNVI